MNVESLFLQYSVDKLRQFTSRIEVCLGKLTEEQIWARGGEHENAAGNLVLHLTGNVRQWIVSSLGNDVSERDRDSEFAARQGPVAAVLAANLHETVERASSVISALDTERLTRMYEIQNYRVSGVEVVYHVVEHFGQHTGQIIFMTKMFTGGDLDFYRHLRNSAHGEQVP
jgi:uncharacterized damage-inducible protein DinB